MMCRFTSSDAHRCPLNLELNGLLFHEPVAVAQCTAATQPPGQTTPTISARPSAGSRTKKISKAGAFTDLLVERCAPAEVQGVDPAFGVRKSFLCGDVSLQSPGFLPLRSRGLSLLPLHPRDCAAPSRSALSKAPWQSSY
jgi:hypothetical protein